MDAVWPWPWPWPWPCAASEMDESRRRPEAVTVTPSPGHCLGHHQWTSGIMQISFHPRKTSTVQLTDICKCMLCCQRIIPCCEVLVAITTCQPYLHYHTVLQSFAYTPVYVCFDALLCIQFRHEIHQHLHWKMLHSRFPAQTLFSNMACVISSSNFIFKHRIPDFQLKLHFQTLHASNFIFKHCMPNIKLKLHSQLWYFLDFQTSHITRCNGFENSSTLMNDFKKKLELNERF